MGSNFIALNPLYDLFSKVHPTPRLPFPWRFWRHRLHIAFPPFSLLSPYEAPCLFLSCFLCSLSLMMCFHPPRCRLSSSQPGSENAQVLSRGPRGPLVETSSSLARNSLASMKVSSSLDVPCSPPSTFTPISQCTPGSESWECKGR